MAEKDYLEKKLEDFNGVFSDIVNVLLFNGEHRVQEEDLETGLSRSSYKVEGTFEEQERDTKKYWRKGTVRIAVFGMENQTGEDPHFPVRCLAYDGAEFRDQIRRRDDIIRQRKRRKEQELSGDNGEESADTAEDLLLPDFYPVITLVLYFGETRWTGSRNLKDHLRIPEGLDPFVPDYKVNVFEIAYLEDEQVQMFQSDFRFVAEYFVGNRKVKEGLIKEFHLSSEKMKHVREVMELLKALSGSNYFDSIMDIKNLDIRGAEKGCLQLCSIRQRPEERPEERPREKPEERLKEALKPIIV